MINITEKLELFIEKLDIIRSKTLEQYNTLKNLLIDETNKTEIEYLKSEVLKNIESYFKMHIEILDIKKEIVENNKRN